MALRFMKKQDVGDLIEDQEKWIQTACEIWQPPYGISDCI